MNDMFLYQSKPRIREGFSNELLARLATNSTSPWEEVKSVLTQIIKPKIFAPMILLLTIFVACAQQFLSPEYHLEKEINGLYVYESNYKIVRLDLYDFTAPPILSEEVHNFYEIQNQYPTIEETMELYSIPVNWPIYVPEGYNLHAVPIHIQYDQVGNIFILYWVNADGISVIQGDITPLWENIYTEIVVAPKMWKSIKLKGIPAILVRGDYVYPTIEEIIALKEAGEHMTQAYWDEDIGLRLTWVLNGVIYELWTPGSLGSPRFQLENQQSTQSVSEDDLIRIAESMIP